MDLVTCRADGGVAGADAIDVASVRATVWLRAENNMDGVVSSSLTSLLDASPQCLWLDRLVPL